MKRQQLEGDHMNPVYDAIIVGAGISGLALSHRLKKQNRSVLLIEKSAGVGGRLATRRAEDCVFDHGAQFIKLRLEEFENLKRLYPVEDIARIWFEKESHLYVTFEKGMTQFAKRLAQGQEILLKERVLALVEHKNDLEVQLESQKSIQGRNIYLTCPLPQSLQLLQDSKMKFPLDLQDVTFSQALVGLFMVQTDSDSLTDFLYQQDISTTVFSISNQQSKSVSPNLCFTVTMQPQWSQLNFEREDNLNLAAIEAEMISHFESLGSKNSAGFRIFHGQLKKWRFSQPLKKYHSPYLKLTQHPRIQLLGDSFGGGSIRGALYSAAEALI